MITYYGSICIPTHFTCAYYYSIDSSDRENQNTKRNLQTNSLLILTTFFSTDKNHVEP